MSFELCLYFINMLSNFDRFISLFGFCGIIFSGLAGFICHVEEIPLENRRFKNNMKIFMLSLLSLFLSCFFPSSKTMYVMAASHYLKQSDEIYMLIKKHFGDEKQ